MHFKLAWKAGCQHFGCLETREVVSRIPQGSTDQEQKQMILAWENGEMPWPGPASLWTGRQTTGRGKQCQQLLLWQITGHGVHSHSLGVAAPQILWAPGTNSITAHPMGYFKIGNIKCFLVTEPWQLLHHVFFCFCFLHHVLTPSPQNNLEVHTVIIPIAGWGKLRLSDFKFAQCCLTSEQEGEEAHPTPVRGHRKIPSEAFSIRIYC